MALPKILEPIESRAPKNHNGKLGPICNNCGGYGFMLVLTRNGGDAKDCPECVGTGINKEVKEG